MRIAFACLACLILAACAEDEQACHDRISADLDAYAVASSNSGNHRSAVDARQSSVSITAIYIDDDRSACDYVTAGPYLERR